MNIIQTNQVKPLPPSCFSFGGSTKPISEIMFNKYDLDKNDLNISIIHDDDYFDANNCDDNVIETIEKTDKNLNEKKAYHQSTIKKLFTENIQHQLISNNSISQSGYYGPINTILYNRIERSESSPLIQHDKFSTDDIIEQTNDIRQMIQALHKDILQLKTNSNKETMNDLSIEEQTILNIATKNLIQVIMSTRIDSRSSETKLLNNVKDNKYNENSHSDIALNGTENLLTMHFQHPNCVTVFTINSSMPQVPTKTTVIATNDDDDDEDEKSYDDYTVTSQHFITTNEDFENILSRDERISNNELFLQQDSIMYNNEQLDWPYHSSKLDPFFDIIPSHLPIAQSNNQDSSFKQIFLSRFHHHHPLNNLSTLQSSSINASNNLSSHLTTLNHSKQRIFRVRKSRIIVSFDDIQQEEDAGTTVICDISLDTNHAHSDNEQQANDSIISLFHSFNSAIQESEILIPNNQSFYRDSSESEDSSSEISNSLYSVTSQYIFI
ncbi:unnamed protein product [Adineta steineri]|uniref:Uncharacterized protein n=1 Tax=Adineta steineri TaxID=433720 RepID=A0A814V6R8_9BILA|nr:unnamed protein product [Adineta steineri]